jgi:hypothetical protein
MFIHFSESKMDVDIALDNMTGAQFAMKINEWCAQSTELCSFIITLACRCQRKGKKQFAIGIIGKNPGKTCKHVLAMVLINVHAIIDKSKHLETATVRIDNFSIDFVNLRTETYRYAVVCLCACLKIALSLVLGVD